MILLSSSFDASSNDYVDYLTLDCTKRNQLDFVSRLSFTGLKWWWSSCDQYSDRVSLIR